jgi:hypothetical protein
MKKILLRISVALITISFLSLTVLGSLHYLALSIFLAIVGIIGGFLFINAGELWVELGLTMIGVLFKKMIIVR